jgi:hypothetical protein
MEKETEALLLIKWLRELQAGRTRPDNKGNAGVVRDAKDYIGYIKGINTKLAQLLNVKEEIDG